jgi:hypothetical protein
MTLIQSTQIRIALNKMPQQYETQKNDTYQNNNKSLMSFMTLSKMTLSGMTFWVKDCQLNNINHNDSEMKCYGSIACHSKYTSMLSDILANAIIPRKSNLDSQR